VHVWILQLHQRCSLALIGLQCGWSLKGHHEYWQPVAWVLALSLRDPAPTP
jgi:hypothetical protein